MEIPCVPLCARGPHLQHKGEPQAGSAGREIRFTERLEKSTEMKKILAISGMIIILLLCAGCSRNKSQKDAEIQTLPATTGSVRNVVTFIGNVTSGQTSQLNWSTDGVIGTVNVQLGQELMLLNCGVGEDS